MLGLMGLPFISQIFSGNWNSERVVHHELQYTIVARYLRFIPLEWSPEGRVGLRVEAYGCTYCECLLRSQAGNACSLAFALQNLDPL